MRSFILLKFMNDQVKPSKICAVCKLAIMLLTLLAGLLPLMAIAQQGAGQGAGLQDQERFSRAWNAASHGEREVFRQLMPTLEDYLLYPYLQYEDLRYRRAGVDAQEMATFLDVHGDWAFTAGLRTAWLKSLGEKERWDSLLKYASDSGNTEVRCYLAHARIARGQTDGLLATAQQLWAVGEIPAGCLRSGIQMAQGTRWDHTGAGLGANPPGHGSPPTPADSVPGAICPGQRTYLGGTVAAAGPDRLPPARPGEAMA